MSTAKLFDVCIVGAGLWGSAAAKYCCERDGTSVCLIGPSEPTTPQDRQSRNVFGAHYDEGRICSPASAIFEWGQLARRSIEKYRHIEEISGIKFYEDVGFLFATISGSVICQQFIDVAKKNGDHFKVLDEAKTRKHFDYLSLNMLSSQYGNDAVVTMLLETHAGYISPRKLLIAQQTIARCQGCEILDDVVNQVINCEDILELTTDGKKTIRAKKVLFCAGATMAFGDLLPCGSQLDLKLKTQQVVLMELSEDDKEKLRGMPVLVVHEERDFGRDCYVLPPIQYPDGKYYLKVGHMAVGECEVTSKEQYRAWYCGQGESDTTDRLSKLVHEVFPGIKPLSTHSDTCVTASTLTRKPYCDMVTARLGVLVGGNGYGAKSSDEIGRMGANMILQGAWDYDMPKEVFKAQWKLTEETSSLSN